MRSFILTLRVVVTGLGLTACHPLACFFPPALPKDPAYQLTSKATWPKQKVEIRVDDKGIPHIFSDNTDNPDADLAYGLGVMHGRDRAFQLLVYKRAATGTLTELFGADYLEVDRQQRIITYRLDEQLAGLAPTDRELLDAYVAGVNEGATWAGKSAEMFVLGVDFPTFTSRDALAITRLQQWGQAVGFDEEMTRFRMVKALGTDDARTRELLVDAPSRGVPIVRREEHDGDVQAAAPPPLPTRRSASTGRALYRRGPVPAAGWQKAAVDELVTRFTKEHGASNEWAVDGAHSKAGVPVLANDPHLSHSGPGIFYMAHLEGPDFTIAGGTFPGIPGVLIGHGRDIAWGVTNAYADTMDLVVLEQNGDDLYQVDGAPVNYGHQQQCFKLGKEADAKVQCEDYLSSIFGPVLPEGYGSYDGARSLIDPGERIALMWTAHEFPADNSRLITAFWRLAKSKHPDEATAALQDFSSPAMAVVSAFTDGSIAFRLTGIVPVRGDDQRVDFPRLGNTRRAGWVGRLNAALKPQSTNPQKGFIVAANQRVVDNDVLTQRAVGFEEAEPFRAERIHERLEKMLADGKPSTEALLSIQQDATSIEARELAPIFGKHCPKHVAGHDDSVVLDFCKAIKNFDGNYSLTSIALPFARTARAFGDAVFEAHVDDELAHDMFNVTSISMALHELTKAEDAGTNRAAIFDDPRKSGREGLDGFVAVAVKRAMDLVSDEAGDSPSDWVWGQNHKKSVRGVLAAAPVVGFLFDTWSREESGSWTAPRAEGPDFNNGMRVRHGAGLRLIAEMRAKPLIRMVNDSGNSGHYGHKHLDDQQSLWSEGKPFPIAIAKSALVDDVLEGSLDLLPKK